MTSNPNAYTTYLESIVGVVLGAILGAIVFNGREWNIAVAAAIGGAIGFVIAFGIRLVRHRTT